MQHLLGLGMAVALYALLVAGAGRRGWLRWPPPRCCWTATSCAVGAGPFMPDVLFEVLMVAGRLMMLWQPGSGHGWSWWPGCCSAARRRCGSPAGSPSYHAVVYVAIVARGWRRTLRDAVLVCVAFALHDRARQLPQLHGHPPFLAGPQRGQYRLRADGGRRRLPDAAPAVLRAAALSVAPARSQARAGWPGSCNGFAAQALRAAAGDGTARRSHGFQPPGADPAGPLRVAGSILSDAAKLFEVHRVSNPSETWISHWQLQAPFPILPP